MMYRVLEYVKLLGVASFTQPTVSQKFNPNYGKY